MLIDPALSFAFALPLASLLAASAIFHARDMRRFAAAIDAYRLLPLGAGSFVAPALIGIEAVIAAGLIAPSFRLEAGLAAAALFSAYGSAMAFNLALGRRDIDCGCAFGRRGAGISSGHVARSALLAIASLVVAAPASARPLGFLDLVSIAGFLAAAAALYAGFEVVFANRALARGAGGGR
jgi:hypothetical protein